MTRDLRVGFVGMTHLGLNSAVAGAEMGFDMVCFDPAEELVCRLRRGELPVVEPDLDRLVATNAGRLVFTDEAAALRACDVVYVAPDVATDDQGRSDLSTIERLLTLAYDHCRPDATVVVLSQVPPGFSRSHRRDGRTLIYQVETLIFGRAVERALHPERTIIGLDNPRSSLPGPYETYLQAHGNPPLLKMRYESAELAKIAINCCLVSSISVANTLAELCEAIGADWSEIAPALKLDRRIGPYSYLAPGLGIAGGNLERDLATVLRFADRHGTDAAVVAAWLANSLHRKDWVWRTLKEEVLQKVDSPLIAVLGLAYKENTHSIKNSPAIALLEKIADQTVAVFDPVVKAAVVPFARDAADALDCCKDADVVAIMTPWPEFKSLRPVDLAAAMAGRVVIDPYRVLKADEVLAAGLDYITLGTPALRSERALNA